MYNFEDFNTLIEEIKIEALYGDYTFKITGKENYKVVTTKGKILTPEKMEKEDIWIVDIIGVEKEKRTIIITVIVE